MPRFGWNVIVKPLKNYALQNLFNEPIDSIIFCSPCGCGCGCACACARDCRCPCCGSGCVNFLEFVIQLKHQFYHVYAAITDRWWITPCFLFGVHFVTLTVFRRSTYSWILNFITCFPFTKLIWYIEWYGSNKPTDTRNTLTQTSDEAIQRLP